MYRETEEVFDEGIESIQRRRRIFKKAEHRKKYLFMLIIDNLYLRYSPLDRVYPELRLMCKRYLMRDALGVADIRCKSLGTHVSHLRPSAHLGNSFFLSESNFSAFRNLYRAEIGVLDPFISYRYTGCVLIPFPHCKDTGSCSPWIRKQFFGLSALIRNGNT